MKEGNIYKLIQKYINAKTTLSEDKKVLESTPFGHWGKFVKNNKIVPPENLNETLWDAFEEKTKPKFQTRKLVGFISVAASIVLIIGVFLFNQEKEQSDAEKEALLKEALEMLEEENEDILYSDEVVTIYY